MATATGVNPRLKALTEAGVSVWLDQIRRSLVEGGELQRMVDEESLRGVTSNPSIFEKAILGSDDYDDELRAVAREDLDAKADLRAARDPRPAGRRRRARGRAPGVGRPRRLRLARGLARPRVRHRGHARGGARLLEASSTGRTR